MITDKEIEAEAYLRYPDDEMESWSNERECFADAVRWALDEITNRLEPKADPKEKELEAEILKILESDQVHNHWQRYNELAGYMENEKTFDYERAAKQLAEYFTVCLNREL